MTIPDGCEPDVCQEPREICMNVSVRPSAAYPKQKTIFSVDYRKVKKIVKLESSKAKIEAGEYDLVSMCSGPPGCHSIASVVETASLVDVFIRSVNTFDGLFFSRGDAEDREGEVRPLSWLYPHRVAPDPVSPTDLRAPNSGNPMARFLGLCTWLLALGPGLLATVRAECSQDCATCSYRLARPTDLNPLACTLECEGKLPSLKTWETCKELLQLTKLELPPDATSALSKQEESHLLAKKYGGFMKRYGGFMKKMDELYPLEAEEEANGGEVLGKRYGGFMKKDAEEDDGLGNSSNLLKELLGAGDQREGSLHQEGSDAEDVSKRYGGFMRGLKRSPHLEDETKELQKRYGGFMRRVGRPEWWMDYQKRYGGFLKRFAEPLPSEEEGESYSKEVPEMEKRYGGFMRF
ncbi:hypothetical protein JEQ12_019303 [Ovis aries]|uniref:Proenkephalin-A n=1 Tax=Ovis aries TaxID=9940 RepID=A0A835ZYQ3_SHEEP|nr:hypothetical protein JEQ12_019303 [Ovis aries]